MKKILSMALCLLLLILGISPSFYASSAEEHNFYVEQNYIFEVVNNSEIAIHHYLGTADEVTVPSAIGGLPVKSIEKWAFYNTDAKEVTVSEGITTLGEEVFYNCQSLESVTLPSTLESTGTAIFRFCQNLKSVTFSGTDSDPELGEYLLYACNSLEDINIPSKVTKIPEGMFAYCQSLENVALPEGTQKIYDNAFYASGLSNITLPKPVYYIGDMAFADCTTLDEVNNLREICDVVRENAFEGSPVSNPYEEPEKITIYFENYMDWWDITIAYSAVNYSEIYGMCEIDMTFVETNSNGKDIYRADIPLSKTIYFNGLYETELYGTAMISSSMVNTIADNNVYSTVNGLQITSYPYSPDIPDDTLPESTDDENNIKVKTNVQSVGDSFPKEFSKQITEDDFPIGAPYSNVVEHEKNRTAEVGAHVCEEISEKLPDVRVRGDADGNKKINIKDATTIQKYLALLITINDFDHKNADANADFKINIRDATVIQKFVASMGTIPQGPVQSA